MHYNEYLISKINSTTRSTNIGFYKDIDETVGFLKQTKSPGFVYDTFSGYKLVQRICIKHVLKVVGEKAADYPHIVFPFQEQQSII